MSGAFDLKGMGFLSGYYDDDVYFNQPLDFLPNLNEPCMLDQMRQTDVCAGDGSARSVLE